MTIHLQNKPKCPICKKILDAATAVEHSKLPQEGDVTICIYCCNFLTFDANHNLSLISAEDMIALPDDVRMLLIKTREILERAKKFSL